MKKVVLTGDEKTIKAVIQENRIRVSRGLINITPADSEESADESFVTDTKEPEVSDKKTVEDTDKTKEPAKDTKEVETSAKGKKTSKK